MITMVGFETFEEAYSHAAEIIASVGGCGAIYYIGGKICRWFVRDDPDFDNKKSDSLIDEMDDDK